MAGRGGRQIRGARQIHKLLVLVLRLTRWTVWGRGPGFLLRGRFSLQCMAFSSVPYMPSPWHRSTTRLQLLAGRGSCQVRGARQIQEPCPLSLHVLDCTGQRALHLLRGRCPLQARLYSALDLQSPWRPQCDVYQTIDTEWAAQGTAGSIVDGCTHSRSLPYRIAACN